MVGCGGRRKGNSNGYNGLRVRGKIIQRVMMGWRRNNPNDYIREQGGSRGKTIQTLLGSLNITVT